MRHSLFFGTFEEANKAEALVNDEVSGITDSFQSNDGETGTIEMRFFTDAALDDSTQRYLIRKTKPTTYALNCED